MSPEKGWLKICGANSLVKRAKSVHMKKMKARVKLVIEIYEHQLALKQWVLIKLTEFYRSKAYPGVWN